jgi:hypothetical protein
VTQGRVRGLIPHRQRKNRINYFKFTIIILGAYGLIYRAHASFWSSATHPYLEGVIGRFLARRRVDDIASEALIGSGKRRARCRSQLASSVTHFCRLPVAFMPERGLAGWVWIKINPC